MEPPTGCWWLHTRIITGGWRHKAARKSEWFHTRLGTYASVSPTATTLSISICGVGRWGGGSGAWSGPPEFFDVCCTTFISGEGTIIFSFKSKNLVCTTSSSTSLASWNKTIQAHKQTTSSHHMICTFSQTMQSVKLNLIPLRTSIPAVCWSAGPSGTRTSHNGVLEV